MKVIDMHAHIFPKKIAEKAAESIGNFYDMPMRYDGTVSTLLSLGDRHGIDQFVVHTVATVPGQVESINTFIAETVHENPDRFIGFATLHPDYKRIEKEVERVISLGIKGIKIHPDLQCFNIDSKRAFSIYEAIEGRLPILIHTGDFRFGYSKPTRIGAIMDRFPKLTVICAHFGGWSEWDLAVKILAGRNLYVDTASTLYAVSAQRAKELIYTFGADNVLFGSDYPMWNPGSELELFNRIDLTEEEREKILHLNMERLLKL